MVSSVFDDSFAPISSSKILLIVFVILLQNYLKLKYGAGNDFGGFSVLELGVGSLMLYNLCFKIIKPHLKDSVLCFFFSFHYYS